MGAVAHVMDGWERLNLLHGVYHPDGEIFNFDWKWLAPSGLSTKDFIAPSSLCFGNAKTFGMGGKCRSRCGVYLRTDNPCKQRFFRAASRSRRGGMGKP